mgnify:CR=1 FL=1
MKTFIDWFIRTKVFHDFLKTALVKEPKKRPNTTQLLKHQFIKDVSILPPQKSKLIIQELIDKMMESKDDDIIDDGDGDESQDKSLDILNNTGKTICLFFLQTKTVHSKSIQKKNWIGSIRKRTSRKTIVTGTKEYFSQKHGLPPAVQGSPTQNLKESVGHNSDSEDSIYNVIFFFFFVYHF